MQTPPESSLVAYHPSVAHIAGPVSLNLGNLHWASPAPPSLCATGVHGVEGSLCEFWLEHQLLGHCCRGDSRKTVSCTLIHTADASTFVGLNNVGGDVTTGCALL